MLGQLACPADMTLRELVADAAATRVQHDPDVVALVDTYLEEVVARTERSELLDRFRALVLAKFRRRLVCVEPGLCPLLRCRGDDVATAVSARAIIPQPMSTPTAEGMTAPSVGMTEPTVDPMPRYASGMSAT